MKKKEVVLILHNIRSEQNVGAIFRTADAAGVGKIYLTGYTPTPIDRFGRVIKTIAKTALGAEKSVAWEQVKTIGRLVKKLRDKGFQIIAIEQSERAVDYKKIKLIKNTAFILGNEIDGIPPALLEKSDVVTQIPMHGKKESLNVGVAAGIALFRIIDV